MKIPLLCFAVASMSLPALADVTNAAPQSPASAGSTDGTADAGRREKFREAFAQLDLSDGQKQKIQQIRASTSAGKERRQQIMAVLNPEQREKLKQMFATWRQSHDGATAQ